MEATEKTYQQRINQVEKELLKARELIDYYKKAHEDFLLIASHDLQSPLRKLSAFVDRLVYKFRDVKSEEVNKYTDRIQSTLAGMRKIIDDLAALAYNGEGNLDFSRCNLDEILQELLTSLAPIFAEANVMVECATLPTIEGNAATLKSVFENIVLNAVKFQNKDIGCRIQITTMPLTEQEKNRFKIDDNSRYYKIVITDNGIGFDNQYSDKIFDPFVRLNGKSDYEGNGLGLALCKKIVEKHKGFIYAKSNSTSGTSFILFFPETHN